MYHIFTVFLFFAILFLANSEACYAQSTSGVTGPVIKDNEQSIEYRWAFSKRDGSNDLAINQRLHYQRSFSDDKRVRLIVAGNSDSIQSFGLQSMWQLPTKHTQALRLDTRFNSKFALSRLSFHHAQEFSLGDKWDSRLVLIYSYSDLDRYENAKSLGLRTNVFKSIAKGRRVGFELHTTFPSSSEIGDNADAISFGPFFSSPLGLSSKISIYTSALVGLTDTEPDMQLRVFLKRSL